MERTEGQDTTTLEPTAAVPTTKRSLVLVVGSGRSGTSLFTGILQRLGFHVPQPEVPADETNPRGFAESQWVVDFHTRLLRRAGVQVSDARPSAWARTADIALDDHVRRDLRRWVGQQFGQSDHVIVKDPRLSWFLPLWRRCAEDVGVSPRFATMLRHPAAVVDSKQRSYGGWQGDVDRTAGWINQVLFTERATRGAPRAFVRYDDLLDDWTKEIGHVGDALDLAVVRDAPAAAIVGIHEFVDRTLARSRTSWDGFDIPEGLRELADEVWELACRLSGPEADSGDLAASLDVARADYIRLYEDAEAIAQSSIVAGRRSGHARQSRRASSVLRRVDRVFPKRYRQRIPVRWRRAVVHALHRAPGGR